MIVMAPTSALALTAIQESIARIWCVGVTHLPVKMEDPAGSKERPTPVSARQDGQASTVTSLVYPVK